MKQMIKPKKNKNKPIADLVISDIKSRKAFGLAKYGTYLQANNGRDALQDAYEEAIDLVLYLRQLTEELLVPKLSKKQLEMEKRFKKLKKEMDLMRGIRNGRK